MYVSHTYICTRPFQINIICTYFDFIPGKLFMKPNKLHIFLKNIWSGSYKIALCKQKFYPLASTLRKLPRQVIVL